VPSFAPISPAELAERRRRFQSQLGEGVALVPGAHPSLRSHDTDFPFRQDSDLWYLTGFEQPEAVAVFTQSRFTFFVQPRDPLQETWNGRRPGVEGAVSRFGADEAFPSSELAARLPGLLENRPRLWHSFGRDRALDDKLVAALADVRARARRGVSAPGEILSPHDRIHEMRLRKSESELEIMRAASAISAEAHHCAAHLCRDGVREYELEAELLRAFRRGGGAGPAYTPIVGAGDNATILHYVENRDALASGQLVLIDAGVELHGYASDVTRTYPVGGRYGGAARDVYQVVLDAQAAGVAAVIDGVEGKVIDRACRDHITRAGWGERFVHGTGHGVGLDIHEAPWVNTRATATLMAGSVVTVEPGVYLPELGGVRVEDTVFVTPTGCRPLTHTPKEPAVV